MKKTQACHDKHFVEKQKRRYRHLKSEKSHSHTVDTVQAFIFLSKARMYGEYQHIYHYYCNKLHVLRTEACEFKIHICIFFNDFSASRQHFFKGSHKQRVRNEHSKIRAANSGIFSDFSLLFIELCLFNTFYTPCFRKSMH
jgi:hypothetical protein